jgi:hypothetical protein
MKKYENEPAEAMIKITENIKMIEEVLKQANHLTLETSIQLSHAENQGLVPGITVYDVLNITENAEKIIDSILLAVRKTVETAYMISEAVPDKQDSWHYDI